MSYDTGSLPPVGGGSASSANELLNDSGYLVDLKEIADDPDGALLPPCDMVPYRDITLGAGVSVRIRQPSREFPWGQYTVACAVISSVAYPLPFEFKVPKPVFTGEDYAARKGQAAELKAVIGVCAAFRVLRGLRP